MGKISPKLANLRLKTCKLLFYLGKSTRYPVGGDPYGTRTRVSAVKGRRPRPLDEGAKISARAVGIRHDTVNQEQNVLFLRQLYLKL